MVEVWGGWGGLLGGRGGQRGEEQLGSCIQHQGPCGPIAAPTSCPLTCCNMPIPKPKPLWPPRSYWTPETTERYAEAMDTNVTKVIDLGKGGLHDVRYFHMVRGCGCGGRLCGYAGMGQGRWAVGT